jgi:hypothetical protein
MKYFLTFESLDYTPHREVNIRFKLNHVLIVCEAKGNWDFVAGHSKDTYELFSEAIKQLLSRVNDFGVTDFSQVLTNFSGCPEPFDKLLTDLFNEDNWSVVISESKMLE